jgi:hypothetical protein
MKPGGLLFASFLRVPKRSGSGTPVQALYRPFKELE